MLSTLIYSSLVTALSVATTAVSDQSDTLLQKNVEHVAVLASFSDAISSQTIERGYCEYLVEQNPKVICTSLRSVGEGIDINDGQAFVDLARQQNADHVLFINWAGLSFQRNPAVLRFTEVAPERAERVSFGMSRNSCYINRYKNEFALSLVSLHSQQAVQSGKIDTYGLEHTGVRSISHSLAKRIHDTVALSER